MRRRSAKLACLIAVALVGATVSPGASASVRPQGCDTLIAANGWTYCFLSSGTAAAPVYSAVRTKDGVHWSAWSLSLSGFTGQLEPQFFGQLAGGTWYLQDHAQGVFSSSDGHAFALIDPLGTNGELNASETTVGTFAGRAALFLAGSSNRPAMVLPEGLAPLPIAGAGGDTESFVSPSPSSLLAVGRDVSQMAIANTTLGVASCDELGACSTGASQLGNAFRLDASAPAGSVRVMAFGGGKGEEIYLQYGNGLRRSAALSKFVSTLQPNGQAGQLQLGWAQAATTDWFIRLVYDPDPAAAARAAPADLILEGSPATDHWTVRTYAPYTFSSAHRPTAGVRAPWTSSACYQPLGASLAWVKGHLVAEVCVATSGVAFVSADRGKHWHLLTR